jgi:adenylate cyclase
VERKLAAILAADVVGYSRLMAENEAETFDRLRAHRKELFEPEITKHHGRVFKLIGDGLLAEFGSVVNAVECAALLQREMTKRNDGLPSDRRIDMRIGVHVGDVIVEGEDRHGDAVNVAARLEQLAEPGGICVSQQVVDHAKQKVALGFELHGKEHLKNIPESVRVYRVRLNPAVETERPTPVLSDKPSIAVLPFANMSGDPDQEYFSDGLTEDIITALSRISALWVIARTSTFTYKGKPTDVKQIAKELGVRYVMEGSVRRVGDRVRVTAQLIDAATGHHLWAERYDRALADLFDIQDEITRSVAGSAETQVDLAEGRAAATRPSTDFKARDLVARALSRIYDDTPAALAEASDFIEEAIRIDPLTPRAQQIRGGLFLHRMYYGQIPHDAANVAQALELARTALRLAPHDEWAHWTMAGAHIEAGQLEDAVAECERSLEINPNCSAAVGRLGACLAQLGRPEEAIEACRLALQLNPRDPYSYWRHSYIALAHFVAADYEAALQESKRIALSRPHLHSIIIWAAAAAALGKTEDARTAVERCLAQRSDLRVGSVAPDIMQLARDEDHERLMALLRKAGLPE